MEETRQGRCLCGAVSYRIEGDPGGVTYCHCSMCRRQTGHFYATINIKREQLTIDGEASVSWYASSNEARRGFCARCGSALFWKNTTSNDIAVLAGGLDKPTGLQEEAHIFVADKGDYYQIEDELQKYNRSIIR